jgi:NitT/TauT family transport system substrate-binding protein
MVFDRSNTLTRAQACATLASAAALGSSFRPVAAGAQQPQTIVCGQVGKAAGQWPWYVGEQLGFFKKYGVTLSPVVVDSVAASAQQLASGSLNVGEISAIEAVEAIKGGAPIKYILNEVVTPPFWLIAKSEIRSIGALTGKTIIIGGVNDITHLCLDAMLKPFGLRPDDYTLTFAGATNTRYAALRSGSVDATLLLPPFSFIAEGQGYSNLGTVLKYFGSFPFTGVAANTQWAQAHRPALVAFAKGFLESLRWLNNPANKAQAVGVLVAASNADPANAEKTYDALVTQLHAFSTTGIASTNDMTKVVSSLVQLKQIEPPLPPAAQFSDNTFIQQATAALK